MNPRMCVEITYLLSLFSRVAHPRAPEPSGRARTAARPRTVVLEETRSDQRSRAQRDTMPAAEYALSTRCGRVGHSDILTQLALKYGTDKASHRFTRHYNMLFCKGRNDIRRVLEVGVFGGASIKMWHEYFPNATIFGVDNFACGLPSHLKPAKIRERGGNRGCLSKAQAESGRAFRDAVQRGDYGPRIRLFSADQSDEAEMQGVVRELGAAGLFDIIIEDGSHRNADQQMNLGLLFPLVRPGALYVIEDIHSSWQKGYDEQPGSNRTTWRMVEHFRATHQIRSRHMRPEQRQYLERWIWNATTTVTRAFRTDQTCIIRKSLM